MVDILLPFITKRAEGRYIVFFWATDPRSFCWKFTFLDIRHYFPDAQRPYPRTWICSRTSSFAVKSLGLGVRELKFQSLDFGVRELKKL